MTDRAVLVTGATGKQGGAVARELMAADYKVRVMTRKPQGEESRALAARGAEVVVGDLDDAESLRRALAGMWGTFAVQNTWEAGVEREEEQGKRFAQIAREAGIQHYVYTSVASAHRRTGIPHFDNKWRIEETIRGLGFPSWVIIRPVFFMENFLSPWFKPGIVQGNLAMAVRPTTVLQMIDVADIGKYGRLAFDKDRELNRREIDIAGDELTLPDTAKFLTEAAGKTVRFVQVPIEEVRKASMEYAIMLEWFDAVGYDVQIGSNAKKFGIRPTPFREWAKEQSWG